MTLQKLLLLIVLHLLFKPVIAQVFPAKTYPRPDSIALHTKYRGDLGALTRQLTATFTTDEDKARVIFRWITNNIRYNKGFYNRFPLRGREPKTFTCSDDRDCAGKQIIWENRYLKKILKKKKAVCAGYSLLFKRMCDAAGLKAEIVPGYIRTHQYQMGGMGQLDHAWNVVWIDTAWYLLDATWAAGGCEKKENGKLKKFQKNFKPYFWLTQPEDFARDHYSKDPKWVMIPAYKRENFMENAYYIQWLIPETKMHYPQSGIITASKGDTLHFVMETEHQFDKLQINTNLFRNPDFKDWNERHTHWKMDWYAYNRQQYVTYTRNGYFCRFDYVVTDAGLNMIDLLTDYKHIMRFLVKIKQ